MPSYYPRTNTSPSRPHLSEILDLYPEEEIWCAGYAPSKGRRCHAPTNAHGRTTAMNLLNEGTINLYNGRDLEGLLYDLAPRVLCTRFHQNQDVNFVEKWLDKVDRFLDSYNYSPSYTPHMPARSALTPRDPESRRRVSSHPVPTVLIQSRIGAYDEESGRWSTFISLEELEAISGQYFAAASSTSASTIASSSDLVLSWSSPSLSPSSSEGPDTVASPGTRSTISASSRSQSRRRPSQASASDSTSSRVSSARLSTNPRLVRQAAFNEAETASSGSSNMSTATMGGISARPHEPTRPRTRERRSTTVTSTPPGTANRRPVEGDCTICLEPLRRARDDGDDDTVEDEEQQLAWCGAQCGTNYHKECIEKWLETSVNSTCPICRSFWRN